MTQNRIGLVGLDSTHADQFVRLLNVDRRLWPKRITAICDTNDSRLRDLQALGDIETATTDPGELVDLVDGVIIAQRNGSEHMPNARMFLAGGVPTYVDKPLADSYEAAREMIRCATEGHGLITSFSPLRWSQGVAELDAELQSVGYEPRVLRATGHIDLDSPYNGLYFHGIHLADLTCRLLAGAVGQFTTSRESSHVRAVGTVGKTVVILRLLYEKPTSVSPFAVSVKVGGSTLECDIRPDNEYLLPGLIRFAQMLDTGIPPLNPHELLRPLKLLAEIERSLA